MMIIKKYYSGLGKSTPDFHISMVLGTTTLPQGGRGGKKKPGRG